MMEIQIFKHLKGRGLFIFVLPELRETVAYNYGGGERWDLFTWFRYDKAIQQRRIGESSWLEVLVVHGLTETECRENIQPIVEAELKRREQDLCCLLQQCGGDIEEYLKEL